MAERAEEGGGVSRITLLLILCLGLMAVGRPASMANGAGVIEGAVVNGTADGDAVGGLGVELRIIHGQSQGVEGRAPERLSVAADREGRFRFEGLSVDSVYQAAATYQGVAYAGPLLQFPPDVEQLTTELLVYDTTADDGNIVVSRAHLLLVGADTEISVTELHILENWGDRTYVGRQAIQGRLWTSRFQLPRGARDVVFEDGAWGGRFLEIEGGFVDTEPIWPGQSTVIFSYMLDCPSGACDLGRTLQQRVSTLNVMLPDAGVAIRSGHLSDPKKVDIQGKSYLSYTASDLAPGTNLDLGVVLAQGARSSKSSPAARSSSALIWIILGTVGVVAFLSYPFWRRRIPGQTPGDREEPS